MVPPRETQKPLRRGGHCLEQPGVGGWWDLCALFLLALHPRPRGRKRAHNGTGKVACGLSTKKDLAVS